MWNRIVRRPDVTLNFRQAASWNEDTTPLWVWGTLTATVSLLLVSAAAWITHVIVCIKASAWILLLFGCVFAPVGVIHGIGIWLGFFQ